MFCGGFLSCMYWLTKGKLGNEHIYIHAGMPGLLLLGFVWFCVLLMSSVEVVWFDLVWFGYTMTLAFDSREGCLERGQ